MIKPAFLAKRLLFCVAVACTALAAGCTGKTPEHSAQTYIDDLQLNNYLAAYQMLTHQDQVDRTMDQFLTEIPLAPDVNRDWFKAVLRAVEFQVGEAKTEGDKANVMVKVVRPDLALWERTIDANVGPNDAPSSIAQKDLIEKTFPKLSYDDNIVLMKQGENWRVFVGFPAKENAAKMRKEALEAFHKFDYDKAISSYQSALAELDKEQATGNAGLRFLYNRELQEIQNIKNQSADVQAYIPKIGLTDVDMRMAASRVPGIFGKMTNNGDRAIDDLQFTVTYYEGKGAKKKEVFSETHAPVTTPFDFSNFSRPVLPYVPGESRTFGFRLTAPADIQQKATPDLNVSAIVFTQSTAPLPKPATPVPSPLASETPTPAASPSMAPLPSLPKP
jgi:hypothetical protein